MFYCSWSVESMHFFIKPRYHGLCLQMSPFLARVFDSMWYGENNENFFFKPLEKTGGNASAEMNQRKMVSLIPYKQNSGDRGLIHERLIKQIPYFPVTMWPTANWIICQNLFGQAQLFAYYEILNHGHLLFYFYFMTFLRCLTLCWGRCLSSEVGYKPVQ